MGVALGEAMGVALGEATGVALGVVLAPLQEPVSEGTGRKEASTSSTASLGRRWLGAGAQPSGLLPVALGTNWPMLSM